MVDGKPFLVRGGELGNSTATNAAYLQPIWSRLADLNLNTVLVPVYWDLVEPEEGRLDFSVLDSVMGQAREHGMRLVLLWFASWKNSMSCYAPAFVKRDPRRFPRAMDLDGVPQEILSPFSPANRDTVRALAHEVDDTIGGFVRGQSALCLVLAVYYGAALWLGLGQLTNVLHPDSPIFDSGSLRIEFIFVVMLALTVLLGVQITWWLWKKVRSPAELK